MVSPSSRDKGDMAGWDGTLAGFFLGGGETDIPTGYFRVILRGHFSTGAEGNGATRWDRVILG